MDVFMYIGLWPIDKFLGFVFFLIMEIMGFWGLIFLISMVPYWITYGAAENYGKINADVDPDEVRRKTLLEQEDIEVIYNKNA